MSTDRAREAREALVCPVCGLIDDARFGTVATCAGSQTLDQDHEPVRMNVVRVVSLAAVVEALRERGEFACGGFEKEAAAFLEAEFGVPQPEQPA